MPQGGESLQLGEIHELESGTRYSAGALRALIARQKDLFHAKGLRPGDSALLRHGNSACFVAELLALWELGTCAVPVDPLVPAPELQAIAQHTDCSLIVSRDGVEVRRRIREDSTEGALLLYTSGTSGSQKGVLHSLEGIHSRLNALKRQITLEDLERTLCLLPTHFGHGLIGNCLLPLLSGATIFFSPPFNAGSIANLNRLIDANEITFLSSVPAIWEMALRFAPEPTQRSLRRVHCASAPLSHALLEKVRRWCEPAKVINVYGMTEAGSWIAGASHEMRGAENGFIGKGWGVEFELRGGEIWIRCDSLMLGYYRDETQTREALREGWFDTGDLGRKDEDGNLILTGRKKNQINKAGMKISPEELDLLLLTHPLVCDVCTFGVPDPIAGETVASAIVFEPGTRSIEFEELECWCRERIAPHKVPSRWFEVPAIPRNSRGKPDRKKIFDLCMEQAKYDER